MTEILIGLFGAFLRNNNFGVALLIISALIALSILRGVFTALIRVRAQKDYIKRKKRALAPAQRAKLEQEYAASAEQQTTTNHLLFISYSRKQFCYAESLALCLQYYGVSTWFDVQKIPSGADWQQCISAGENASTALLLVASRESLQSDYVRAEWQHALEANKPIYIVMFEAVELPDELKNASIIDGRLFVKTKMRRLAEELLPHNRIQRDSMFLANPHFFLTRIPLWIVGGLLSMWMATLLPMVGITIMSIIELLKVSEVVAAMHVIYPQVIFTGLALLVNWGILSSYAIIYPILFSLRRRFNFTYFVIILFMLSTIPMLLFGIGTASTGKFVSADFAEALRLHYLNSEGIAFGLIIGGVLIFGSFVVRRTTMGSCAGLWWLSTGVLNEKARLDSNQRWIKFLPPQPIPREEKITYQLHYVPTDKLIADNIKQVFGKYQNLLLSASDRADYHLVVLTHHVPLEWLESQLQRPGRIICVVCTNIHKPQKIQQFQRYQWFDYRKRSPEQLELLASRLTTSGATTRNYNFSVLPEQIKHSVVPRPIALVAGIFRIMAALDMGLGLFSLLNIGLKLAYLLIAPAALCAGWYLFKSAAKVEHGKMTKEQFILDTVFLLSNVLLYNIVNFLIVIKIDPNNFDLGDFLVFFAGSCTVMMVIFIISLFFDRKFSHPLFSSWFLTPDSLALVNRTVTLAVAERPWHVIAPYLLLAVQIALLFLANFS